MYAQVVGNPPASNMRYTAVTVDLCGETVPLLPEEGAVWQRLGQLQRRIASAYQRGALRQVKDLQKLMLRAHELREVVSRILDRLQNEQAKNDRCVDTCLLQMALAPMVAGMPEIPVFHCSSALQVRDALSRLGALEPEQSALGYWRVDCVAQWHALRPAIAADFSELPDALASWFWRMQVKALCPEAANESKAGVLVCDNQMYLVGLFPTVSALSLASQMPDFIGCLSEGVPFLDWQIARSDTTLVVQVRSEAVLAHEVAIKAVFKHRSWDVAEMLIALNRLQRCWHKRHRGLSLRSVHHALACYRAARLMQHLRRLHPNKPCAWIRTRYAMNHQSARVQVNDEECVTLFPYGSSGHNDYAT